MDWLCTLWNFILSVHLICTTQKKLKTHDDVKPSCFKNKYLVTFQAVPHVGWLSLASPCGSPHCIICGILWWTRWHWDRCFSENVDFIVSIMHHTQYVTCGWNNIPIHSHCTKGLSFTQTPKIKNIYIYF